jgi:hypothetical protein
LLAPRRGLFANGLKALVGTFSKIMGDVARLISQVKLKAISLTFKGIFPELSNFFGSPGIAGGLPNGNYLFEDYQWKSGIGV